ncbi:unnamed protein product [Camellia sinensis]
MCCVGWCDKFRSESFAIEHPPNVVNMGLRADVVHIDQSLCTTIVLLMETNRSSPRTPSKNRGKAVTATQQQPVHKCQFNSDNTKMFLQLVIAEMDVGNRQPCGLSMTGYKNVANKFLDKTELLHLAKQMKNKFDNLKKDWVAWKKLENAAQGLTGLGYAKRRVCSLHLTIGGPKCKR